MAGGVYGLRSAAANDYFALRSTGGIPAAFPVLTIGVGAISATAISGYFQIRAGSAQSIDFRVSNAAATLDLYINSYRDFLE
jgi:hypothetical protein